MNLRAFDLSTPEHIAPRTKAHEVPWVLIVLAILPGAALAAFSLELLWRSL